MRNAIKKLAILALFVFSFAGLASAQTPVAQTTLSAAMTVGTAGGNSGIATGVFSTTATLAASSVTVTNPAGISSTVAVQTAFNGVQPVTILYVGNEAMGVLTATAAPANTYNVLRGMFGTKIAPHPSGDMVLFQVITPQFSGGFSGGGGLQTVDPPVNGNCTQANTLVTPWVNMLTGYQWLCSPTTLTWVPGFNNPWGPFLSGDMGTVASVAGAQTVLGPFFRISGTNAITSFTIPTGLNATGAGAGSFCVYPTGAFTTTATNNIASASTAVVGKTLCFTWNASTSKFSASY